MALYRSLGCFGACADIFDTGDSGPALAPAPGGVVDDTGGGAAPDATAGAADASGSPFHRRHVLPWWVWLGIGLLVAVAVRED